MKLNPRRLFFCWSLLIFVLTILRSTKLLDELLTRKDRDRFSPQWLSTFVAEAGPLPMWLLLVFSYFNAGAMHVHRAHWISLFMSISFYFSLIFIIRKGKEMTNSGWDPSGHLFIYALQLIPSWINGEMHLPSFSSSSTSFVVLSSLPSHSSSSSSSSSSSIASLSGLSGNLFYSFTPTLLRSCILLWSILLFWMTSMTALFFHLPSEIAATWLISATLFLGIEKAMSISDEFKSIIYLKSELVSIEASLYMFKLVQKPSAILYLFGALLAFGFTIKKGTDDYGFVMYFLYLIYDLLVLVFVALIARKLQAEIQVDDETKLSLPSIVPNEQDDKQFDRSESSRRRNSPIQRS